MVEAFIKGKMIGWAIERIQETPESFAHKLKIKPEKLLAWEGEKEYPSMRQAEDLARKLKIPFGYLYLVSPPVENLPLPDLRTISSTPPNRPSPNFLDIIYDALRKRDWYREYLQNEKAPVVPFIGRFGLADDPNHVANSIRSILQVNDNLRQQARTWNEFLTLLIRKAEESRILVLRSGIVGNNTHRKLDVGEFRGFAISDDLAPVVFINQNDYKTAQIFTLAHELVHLWIGESGVSNPDYKLRADQQKYEVDQFCDKVAAEVLVPSDDFDRGWDGSRSVDRNIQDLAFFYKVSAFVILRRAYTLDKIAHDIYQEKYQELLAKIRAKPTPPGGNFYNLVMSRNSTTLTRRLLIAVAENKASPIEAARLLNVHVASLRNVETYFRMGLANA